MERDDSSKLPANYAEKIRGVISLLQAMEEISEFFEIPRGAPHALKGDRKCVHAITISPNWRITFRHDPVENEIFDLDFEDYH